MNTTHQRVVAAIARAHKLYPAPVADSIVAELTAWDSCEGRYGGHGKTAKLIDHLLRAPLPPHTEE